MERVERVVYNADGLARRDYLNKTIHIDGPLQKE